MKFFTITMALLLSVSLHAETTTIKKTTTVVETTKSDDSKTPVKKEDGKVLEAAKSVSGETKRLLRRIGRKSMDETCELKLSKAECDKEKAEHATLNKKDEIEGVKGN
jgi:hypothetical protein